MRAVHPSAAATIPKSILLCRVGNSKALPLRMFGLVELAGMDGLTWIIDTTHFLFRNRPRASRPRARRVVVGCWRVRLRLVLRTKRPRLPVPPAGMPSVPTREKPMTQASDFTDPPHRCDIATEQERSAALDIHMNAIGRKLIRQARLTGRVVVVRRPDGDPARQSRVRCHGHGRTPTLNVREVGAARERVPEQTRSRTLRKEEVGDVAEDAAIPTRNRRAARKESHAHP